MTTLILDATHVTGTLPPEWAAHAALRQLSTLQFDTSDITGTLPHSPATPALCTAFIAHVTGS